MKRLELSTILCLTFVSIVLGWPERMLAQRSGHAGSFHSGGFHGRGSHPAFQGVHAYGNYRSAGYDGGHGNYYGWRAAYGGYYPHYRYGYGWGFRIGFGFGPYWYYGFPYGYGPWWGPPYPYTYSNYYPYYVPPCCPYPYQRSSNPPPANPAPNFDGDSSPQHFTTPAPENPPSNNYLTDAADPSISLRRTTHGTTGTATDSESAPPSASELPPPRPEVQKAIRALREMPPHARRREIDHGRYSHFSPAERRFLKTALPSRSTFKELETDCASGAAACPQGVNIGRRDFVF